MYPSKPRLVGLNHIALDVGDVEEALRFYGSIFSFDLRGSHWDESGYMDMGFIDLGDQFLALSRGQSQTLDEKRHFGLVVDDKSAVRALAETAGAELIEGTRLDFRDPQGNRVEIVEYRDVRFTKSTELLRSMDLHLDKSEAATDELRKKGAMP